MQQALLFGQALERMTFTTGCNSNSQSSTEAPDTSPAYLKAASEDVSNFHPSEMSIHDRRSWTRTGINVGAQRSHGYQRVSCQITEPLKVSSTFKQREKVNSLADQV